MGILPDPELYARRAGADWPPRRDLDYLDDLILSCQTNVPYENLQCHDSRETPSLDTGSLFDKVVLRRRGGYCFELNSLFLSFLKDAGFDAWAVSCCVFRGRPYIPAMLHRGSIVRLDGELYYCDVGFGGPQPPCATPLGGSAPPSAPGTASIRATAPGGSSTAPTPPGRRRG